MSVGQFRNLIFTSYQNLLIMQKFLWLCLWILLGIPNLQAQSFINGDFETVLCPNDCSSANSTFDCIDGWFEGLQVAVDPLDKRFCPNETVCNGNFALRLLTTSGAPTIVPQTANPYFNFNFGDMPEVMSMNINVIDGDNTVGVHIGGTNLPPGNASAGITYFAFASPGVTNTCQETGFVMPPEAANYQWLVFRTAGPSGSHGPGYVTIMDDVTACGSLFEATDDCGLVTVFQPGGCNTHTATTYMEVLDSDGEEVAYFEEDNNGPFVFQVDKVDTYTITGFLLDSGGQFHFFEFEYVVDQVAIPEVTTTNITKRNCIAHDFSITGTYNLCPPTTATSIVLEFHRNGSYTGVSVPATVNSDGTWDFDGIMSTVVLTYGLDFGTWYDIIPVMTTSSGDVIRGDEFVGGVNNDLFFANRSDPRVNVNSSSTNPNIIKTRFCEDDPLFYHGFDPLTNNHFSAIRRKPIGAPGNYGDYRDVGWVGAPLDGFTGDLRDQYPGYFEAGYEYELYIATSNTAECIAWSPTTVIFQVVDCCAPAAEIYSLPECLSQGQTFTIAVIIDAPLTAADIERIYSTNPYFTYVSHVTSASTNNLVVLITFTSNNCSCDGSMLVFDIVLVGCSEPIWIMTDPIPCCLEECEDITIKAWETGECIIVNGKPAREFSLLVTNGSSILNIGGGSNNATCQVNPLNLQVTDNGNGTSTITGIMVFEDAACTGNALLTLEVETENGCCVISRPFSFPGGCVIPEECQEIRLKPQLLRLGSRRDLSISMNLPLGTPITIIDHRTNTSYTFPVGIIECGPWAIDINGNVSGFTNCNGFTVPIPEDVNCDREGRESPSLLYHYEIRYGDCVWHMIGDYCQLVIENPHGGPGLPGDETPPIDQEDYRLGESTDELIAPSVSVYPNPLQADGLLNFEVEHLSSPIRSIYLTDAYGKLIEVIQPQEGQKRFQHQLQQPLSGGVYFVVLQLTDGSSQSTRLIAIE